MLLYLRQEGRGIGLANKLRAYALQDRGLDTVDANLRLGFADDERDYGHAAAMLRALGLDAVRLLTNNPNKVAGLEAAGIAVVERVPHHMPANPHNADYLATKRDKSGHLSLIEAEQRRDLLKAVRDCRRRARAACRRDRRGNARRRRGRSPSRPTRARPSRRPPNPR